MLRLTGCLHSADVLRRSSFPSVKALFNQAKQRLKSSGKKRKICKLHIPFTVDMGKFMILPQRPPPLSKKTPPEYLSTATAEKYLLNFKSSTLRQPPRVKNF